MMANSQMENTKMQYLKNIEKSLLLNNRDNSLNEVINNVQSLIAQCSMNNQPVDQPVQQHDNNTKFQINNKNEDILKYKSYLDFLNFRKNKILKSINEYQYNFDININKLNESLEKTNKDIEKYTLILNNLENNNLEKSSNAIQQVSQQPINRELNLNSVENNNELLQNKSSPKNNKEKVTKKEKKKNKKQELKEEKVENNLKISDFLNNLNEEDSNSTSNNVENNNIETFNQFVNNENENDENDENDENENENENFEIKKNDNNLLNILGNIVDNLN